VINDSQSYNINSKEENCIASVSDSPWSKLDHMLKDNTFHSNTRSVRCQIN